MNRSTFFALIFLMVTSLITTTCDMTFVSPSPEKEDREITQNEREELEKNGHFLKITHMPVNIQITNVASVSVANSVTAIARRNQNDHVRIFRDTDTATVYIPLVYNDESEFTETGSFYVAFTIHVDALVSYIVLLTDKVVVPFTEGRGELDVRTLPVSGQGNSTPDLTENERNELEKSGHFLKLTYMPLHTQSANVAAVQIANSVSSVATIDKNQSVRIFRETDTSTVYIPLMYFDTTEFTENGSFYVAFTIHVDALVSYIVLLTDKVVVPFTEGRGELDIRTLPYGGIVASDRRYLTIYNLPLYLLSQNVTKVSVNNRYGPVAQCQDYSLVTVSTFGSSSTVSIPLSFVSSNAVFSGTGSFYVTFDIYLDALTHYTVTATDRVLVYFLNGNGYMDINDLPNAMAAEHRYLTITNLPANLLAQYVSNVFIRNQSGPVAQCEDYNLLEVSVSGGKASVRIPLVFTSTSSMFTGTGNFVITFNINIDANTSYIVTATDNVMVSFLDGNGSFDITKIPIASVQEHRYLTITNLPSNLLAQNVSNVFIRNQSGPVAQCEDYNLLAVSVSGGKASVRIPLVFTNNSMFTGTGNFVITFNINIDANTSYIVTATDNVMVSFSNGNGTLNINNIPEKLVPYLTIRNLPVNTKKQHFVNINVYNNVSVVASCSDFNDIVLLSEGGHITAKIPLSSSSGNSFQDTGRFAIAFAVNVDVETHILVSRDHNIVLDFIKGEATFDLVSTYGFFSAELVNPSDTAKPIIKAGAEFDINGYRHKITSNLDVPANFFGSDSGIIYLYALRYDTDIYFEFSSTVPAFNATKNGYYSGYKRALWKMVFIRDGSLFLFKTYIADNFPQLEHYVLNDNTFSTFAASRPQTYSLSGNANPDSATINLQPGVYAIKLTGAGGGGGYGSTELDDNQKPIVSGSSSGGSGGTISEIFTVNTVTPFLAFTGSGGSAPAAPDLSGCLAMYGYKTTQVDGGYTSNAVAYTSCTKSSSVTSFNILLTVENDRTAAGGGSGGGGGSGTFLYSAQGYFLCAGGGGGGSGGSLLTPGGAGGTGGSIGSGSGGGASGFLRQLYNTNIIMTVSTGGNAGNGGGSRVNLGGQSISPTSDVNGGNGSFVLSANTTLSGGYGAASYEESVFDISNNIDKISNSTFPLFWLETMTYRISESSGSGGSVPATLYAPGPNAWLNTNDASGSGASSPSLCGIEPTGGLQYSISNHTSGSSSGGTIILTPYIGSSNIKLKLEPNPGSDGAHGGNNRNETRGGGAPGGSVIDNLPTDGSPGSITIYKIY